jgi:pSer/pThr/pTyr-binding forkhead associated (FHA) protein
MSARWFVEILARNGEVRNRHRIDTLPIHLGRAYDNDFILDDPHAAAYHAAVELNEDGALTIRDLGSKNGTIHQGQRRSDMIIDGNTVVRLGHTNLRIRAADFRVDDELADTTIHSWEGFRPAITGLTLIALLSVASTWLTDTEKIQAIRYVLAAAYLLGGALAWSGIWAFVNRLFGGHARFGRHLFIVACGLLTMQAWTAASNITAYAFSLETLTRYAVIASVVIIGGMMFFHLSTINPHRVRRFATVSLLLTILASGILLMNNYQSTGHTASELYMHVLLPPEVRVSADMPVAQFINDAVKLKAKVDAERGKIVNGEIVDGDDDN